eukprot:698291-Rhodomonas_salina.1
MRGVRPSRLRLSQLAAPAPPAPLSTDVARAAVLQDPVLTLVYCTACLSTDAAVLHCTARLRTDAAAAVLPGSVLMLLLYCTARLSTNVVVPH